MNKILRYEITDRCNQKCDMCWSNEWKHTDMGYKDIEKMIKEYSKKYPKGTVVLTSREPLLSPHFKEVLLLTKELDLEVKLLTNGTLFADNICKLIMESNINFISISIHGNKKTHDKIVNVEGSFDRILKGLKKINIFKEKYNRNDLIIRITTVINNDLLNNIDEIIDISKEFNTELRIQHLMWHSKEIKNNHKRIIKDILQYDDNDIDGFPDKIDFSYSDVINLIDYSKRKCSKLNIDLQIYPDLNNKEIKFWYSNNTGLINAYCDHVDNSIRVRANGDITLCQYIDKTFGNVKNNNFIELIESNEYKKISIDLKNGKLYPICNHCCHLRFKENVFNKDNEKI